MNSRDQFLKDFRGEMLGSINVQSSAEEFFQNQTLRPILKLQNDLFLEVFCHYIIKSKSDFHHFSIEKKLKFIENSIQKDIKLRNNLKGIIIGLFTVEEYQRYEQMPSSLNKRMMVMLVERLQSQVQFFEPNC
jgi:hypothetical protein